MNNRWKHKVVVVEDADPQALAKALDRESAEGWEVVSVAQTPILSVIAVFRRRQE